MDSVLQERCGTTLEYDVQCKQYNEQNLAGNLSERLCE